MDYSYILKTSKVLPEKLAEFGFEEKNGSYFCRKNILNGDFYSIIELKGNFLTAKVLNPAQMSVTFCSMWKMQTEVL